MRFRRYGPCGKIARSLCLSNRYARPRSPPVSWTCEACSVHASRLQERILHRRGQRGHARHLGGRILQPSSRQEVAAQGAARQNFAARLPLLLKSVRRLAIQGFSADRVALSMDVAAGEPQPEVVRVLAHQHRRTAVRLHPTGVAAARSGRSSRPTRSRAACRRTAAGTRRTGRSRAAVRWRQPARLVSPALSTPRARSRSECCESSVPPDLVGIRDGLGSDADRSSESDARRRSPS